MPWRLSDRGASPSADSHDAERNHFRTTNAEFLAGVQALRVPRNIWEKAVDK
jgi:hypothetical protein